MFNTMLGQEKPKNNYQGGASMYHTQQRQITQKEKLYLQDQLHHEQVCLSKCNNYVNQVQDPQVRNTIQQVKQDCEEKVNFLQSFLQQSGFSQN